MAAVIGLLVVLEAASILLLAAGFGFDLAPTAHWHRCSIVAREQFELLRWGALLDLRGYVSLGVVVLYVAHRLRASAFVVRALTASGVGLLVFFFPWLLWLALRLWQGPHDVNRKAQMSRG